MDNKKLWKVSLLDAAGVLAYVSIVALVMTYAERIFGNSKSVTGPIAFLMLLVLSAAIVGSLIFARPVLLYLDGQKKEAVKLLIYTIVCLAAFTILAFSIRLIIA